MPLPPPTDSCDDHASGFESDGGAVIRSRHRNRAYSGPRDARDGYHGGAPYHQQLARSQPALAYAVHGGGGGGCRDDCGGPRPLGDGVSATSAVLRGRDGGASTLANSTHSVARSYAGGPISTASNSTAVLRHQASLSLPPNQFARHPVSFFCIFAIVRLKSKVNCTQHDLTLLQVGNGRGEITSISLSTLNTDGL